MSSICRYLYTHVSSPGSAEPMGLALEFAHAEMLASVAEAEARYVVKDQATEFEMPRMKAMAGPFGPWEDAKGLISIKLSMYMPYRYRYRYKYRYRYRYR